MKIEGKLALIDSCFNEKFSKKLNFIGFVGIKSF
jgi:hypothetical protein